MPVHRGLGRAQPTCVGGPIQAITPIPQPAEMCTGRRAATRRIMAQAERYNVQHLACLVMTWGGNIPSSEQPSCTVPHCAGPAADQAKGSTKGMPYPGQP